ncbi:hypothetical protein MKJ04_03545 [Pontibacter sp. E15-1]|uniref:hypothetical protein n=1 Tax=Pontibacter sp. E15-1 TaxID=2919918 RepID=UPI001F4F116E|nr:hypothetical protein [Pontibacter sp. E15-1]MCJ8163901.1 hypothetical protein [Pontibacter sp. E15-1]
MPTYSTFSETISAMRERGFVHTFTIQRGAIFCPELAASVPPERLTLVERHRVPSPDTISRPREVFGFRTDDNLLGLMTSTYAEYDPEGFQNAIMRCKTSPDLRP